jgi:K+-sensing histidine kinase KdpD
VSATTGDEHVETEAVIRRVGHDLRNKLGVMQNSVYYLNMKVGQQSDKLAKHLGILAHEIDVSNRTITNLMDYVAPKVPQQGPLNLNLMLQEVAQSQTEAPRFAVSTRLAPDLPLAWVDALQMRRVLENAWAYELAVLDETHLLRLVTRGTSSAVVEWIDNGPGLSLQELATLFSPCDEQGTGLLHLGLAVARSLVVANGGSWEVESRQGLGTRISMHLPVAPTP